MTEQAPGGDINPSAVSEMALALWDAKTFTGDDGRLYPILGNHDSYYWLRAAERVLETGSPCDVTFDNHCVDNLSLAPYGTLVTYGHSLHVYALAAFHRFAQQIRPGIPLSASAMLLPLVVSIVGCVPAYMLGRWVGGSLGGVIACLVIGLNPVYLARSALGDNDIWNVVFPLFAFWAIVAAMRSTSQLARVSLVVVAAIVIGIHAATWSGWPFAAVVIGAGIGATMVFHLAQVLITEKVERNRARQACLDSVGLLVGFTLAVVVSIAVVISTSDFVSIPWNLWTKPNAEVSDPSSLSTVARPSDAPSPSGPVPQLSGTTIWPDSFADIAELRPVTRERLVELLGKPWLILVLLGLYSLLLPDRAMNSKEYASASWITLCGYLLGIGGTANFLEPVIALALIPHVLAVATRLRQPISNLNSRLSISFISIAWFAGALYVLATGDRMLLLAVVPYGILCASLLCRIADELRPVMGHSALSDAVAGILSLGIIFPLYQSAKTSLEDALIPLDNAWWSAFESLRSSPQEAIISTPWEYGHFAKYVARRRVLSDGASVGTHINHWFLRALANDSERESVGLLRMLHCGSDALPLPQGAHGAFGLLRISGISEREIYRLVLDLANMERKDAAKLLRSKGFPIALRRTVLNRTHCLPPPGYLVISDEILKTATIWNVGLWNYRKAELVALAKAGARERVVSALTDEFNYQLPQIEQFLRESLSTERAKKINSLAAVSLTLYGTHWNACDASGIRTRCMIETVDVPRSRGRITYEYADEQEAAGTLTVSVANAGREHKGQVASVFVARPGRLEEFRNKGAQFQESAVLLDPLNSRIFLAPRFVIQSTLVQLLLLDGRYSRYFRKMDEVHSIVSGDISTWRIDFDQ